MGDIYAKAHRTLIWLAEETLDLKNAFSALEALRALCPPDRLALDGEYEILDEEGISQLIAKPELVEEMDLGPVVQEVVKSRDPILIIGSKTLPWGVVQDIAGYATAASLLPLITVAAGTAVSSTHVSHAMLMSCLRHREPSSLKLAWLLGSTAAFSCTDARDHIFALLGMVPGVSGCKLLRPDYSVSTAEVLRRYVEWSVKQASLDFLGFCCFPDETDPHAPSWLPRLGDPKASMAPSVVQGDEEGRFRAGGNVSIKASVVAGATKMCISGMIVDEIEAISLEQLPSEDDMITGEFDHVGIYGQRKHASWLREALKIAQVTETGLLTEPFTALVQAMTWGCYAQEEPDKLEEKLEAARRHVDA
ncbi:hypothetical protein ACJZ2D_014992 [Fusarium nematophilum]